MKMKAPKTAGRTAVYTFDAVLVEVVDWEVDVEIFEDVAVGEEDEDEVSEEFDIEEDCGVFVAPTVVVPVAEECLSSSGLNRVSLRDRIGGRMRDVEDAVVFTPPKDHGVDASQTSMEMPCSESRQGTLPT
jgi:hypothetical protein